MTKTNKVVNQHFSFYNISANTSIHNNWIGNASGTIRDSFTMNPEGSFAEANSFQTPPKFTNEFITSRGRMEEFLKDYSQHEKDISSAIDAQNNLINIGTNSFWGNSRFDEIIASLKNSFYQLSPHNNKQNTRDESYSSKDQENNSEIIRKISANKLSNYTANLKMVSRLLV